ncbi:sensor domain-containing diguanylate cyclase [Motiliproteus sp. SC1-56]|uniref:sensor domain-containing diguanylate cyclase n=1 Tax=Motiliproteus sp. SC1-56 TaxID=2799565 RepID=UPI001A901C25|nr:sensor domain-containing diguanylate cyclase [Motiliproteus sp. SC1-56]
MLDFFHGQMDYLSFIKGLLFLFFSGGCLLYHSKDRLNPFLFPLVWFGLFQALLAWSHYLVHFYGADARDVHHYSHSIELLSYLCLLAILPGFLLRGRRFALASTWVLMVGFGLLLSVVGHSEIFNFYLELVLVLASTLAVTAIFRYRSDSRIRTPSYIAITILLISTALFQSLIGPPLGSLLSAEKGAQLLDIVHAVVVCIVALVVWLDIVFYVEEGDPALRPAREVARDHRVKYGVWLGISLLLVLFAGWYGVQVLGENAIDSVKGRTQAATEILSNQIRDEIARADLAANILAKSINVPEVFTSPEQSHSEVKLILDQMSSVLESSVAFLMRTDGHVPLASSNAEGLAGSNFGFLPYFQESVAYGLVGRDFAVEPNLTDRGYYVSHPVFTDNRTLAGVAVVKKLLAQGNREFKTFENWFLLDPNGVIFISGREDLLLKSLWNFPEARKQELTRIGHLGPGPFEAIFPQQLSDGDEVTFEGRPSVASIIDINAAGWKAAVIGDFSHEVQSQRLSGIGVTLFVSLFILTYFIVAQREAVFEQQMAEDKIMLESMNDQLELQAATDRLTGAFNRHKFESILQDEVSRANRYGTSFSLALFDIDHFKSINDTFGHQAGDEVLKGLVGLVREHERATDQLVRWGGEEFIVMMPMTNLAGARVMAERLRKAIEKHAFPHGKPVTASFGIAQYDGTPVDGFLNRIDEALYRAKDNGRNQVQEAEAAS